MTEERILALLRAAERLGCHALRWLPYPDECPEWLLEERHAAQRSMTEDLEFVRAALKEQTEAVLNIAEHKGMKRG